MKIENDKIKFNIEIENPFLAPEEQEKNEALNLKFYYDETNNSRGISLTNNKDDLINIEISGLFKNFVLGGIVLKDNQKLNINSLKDVIKLNKNVKEIKLNNLAKGDFLEILNSKKIELFFNWFINENVDLHYININKLYWIIVDIIDSLDNEIMFQHNRELKSILYLLVQSDIKLFIKILYSFNYPNIDINKEKDFISELINFIDKYKESIHEEDLHYVELLKKILNNNQKELIFLKGENKKIDKDFNHFYLEKIHNFPNSYHYFDREDKVISSWEKVNFQYKGQEWKNYKFIDSKSDTFIQISDVLVGIIAKFNEFMNKSEDLQGVILNLNRRQIDNIISFLLILKKSYKSNIAFQNDIIPISNELSYQNMLHYLSLYHKIII
ncbi:DUF3800 domain-containing protein [Aliarcobacter butzleri]|uniref:DUF3800 domain-containing protein n=1 Tax=Aliarcobacter butzleri TaxID=28197 RepID=UPI0021B65AB6|nr:DUF3800 domain-containing protein [Aliarcobacter butzleri]MCT7587723.1 hypothetical protein [Aliarcobacter butzleri]